MASWNDPDYRAAYQNLFSVDLGQAKRKPQGIMVKATSCRAKVIAGVCVVTLCGPELPLGPNTPQSAQGLPQKPQPDPNHARVGPHGPASAATPLASQPTPGTTINSPLSPTMLRRTAPASAVH